MTGEKEAAMDEPREGLVLLDVSPGLDGEFDQATLERMGHPVMVCHGPEVAGLCPLLGGQGCPKFDQAHGIVFKLDLDRAQHRAILHRYRQLARPELPIRVLATPSDAQRHAELLGEVEAWYHEPTVADLDGFAAEVEAADRYT
jgi:hypothetical protein